MRMNFFGSAGLSAISVISIAKSLPHIFIVRFHTRLSSGDDRRERSAAISDSSACYTPRRDQARSEI